MNHLLSNTSRSLVLALLAVSGSWAFTTSETRAEGRDAEKVAMEAAAALYEGIRVETLPNGLRVFLKPVPKAPTVTTMVAYKVGSADEELDHTGLSHYLEHLMFKGTDKIMPGDIDRLTLRNGGANNANTSEDMTVYHFDFAADRWQDALKIEADRMRNIRIDQRHEFEQEKGAVIEELESNEDRPWDLEQKAILPLLFGKGAPYGHPVIGERRHVKDATAAVIKAHYDKWYYPNNAVLVIAGGFDPEPTLAQIKQLFGPLPRGELPPRKKAAPVSRQTPVHHEIPSKFESPRMILGFNTIRTGDPGYHALEIIQALLTGGKTGRLYKTLVEGKAVASAVDSSNNTGRFPGWFEIHVELLPDKDRKQAEDLVLKELQRLRDEPVSAAELRRAQRGILTSGIFNRESVHQLADSIARGVTTNDLDYLKNYFPRIAAVTAKEVQETARAYLDAQRRVVVWSVPGKDRAGNASAAPPPARQKLAAEPGTQPFSLKDTRRITLANGLTVLLLENHRLPIVVAQAFVRNVRLVEPENQAGIATLTGLMLDEGTARHTGPEIAESIENVGGDLSLSASGGSVKVLAPDQRLGLGLLLECLAQAQFPETEFNRQRQRLLSRIDDVEQQPEDKAQRVFEEVVYGKHPLGRPALGRRKTVAALTPADCRAFHRQLFVPNNTLLAIVGDFDSQETLDELKRLTAGWHKGDVALPKLPEVLPPAEFIQKILTMPGAVQLHFLMGQPGIRRSNPDYFKLLVMDYVLGTGPGFTDRLSARLRDREGLGYTVSANITSSAVEEPGLFRCYIGTDPKNFARVKQLFLEELNRIRDQDPSAEEVEDAKKYLLGNLPFQLTTSDRVAAQLLAIERFRLGLGYFDDYRRAVAAVTPADVRAMARKYLDPKKMVLVAAGPVDATGKVLTKKPAGSPDQTGKPSVK